MNQVFSRRIAASFVAAAVLALALSVGISAKNTTRSSGLTNVTVMADYFLAFYHAPFFVAMEKGWYKDAGLNVTYATGDGSDNTATQVSAGRETFGLVGSDAVARAVAHGESVKNVAQLVSNAGLCAVVRADSGLNTFKDLSGKSYASAPGGLTTSLLPELEKNAGLSPGSIKLVPASYTAVIPGYLQKKFDSIGGFDYGEVLVADHQGVPSKCISFASDGVKVLGFGLITSNNEISKDPAAVKGFVQATVRAWNWTFAHPQQALDIMSKLATKTELTALFPNSVNLQGFAALHKDLVGQTSDTKGTPLGCSSTALWTAMENNLKDGGNIPKVVPASQLYTNQFVGNC